MHIAPPTMPPSEGPRVQVQRLRRRIIDGNWHEDALQRMVEHFGRTRTHLIGLHDKSANPARVIMRELSSLYLTPPTVWHEAGDGVAPLLEAVRLSGLWSRMQRYQTWVLGCREYLMRVDAPEGEGRLTFRPVAPDMVYAEARPDVPDVPVLIWEARLRTDERGGPQWQWDVLDIRDPDHPVYAVHEIDRVGELGADITARVLGGSYSGDAYPYRRSDGTPILPYVLHHAETLGDRLWDPWEGAETMEGSLTIPVLLSFWQHVMYNASYPQRYMAGGKPAALETRDEEGRAIRHEVVTDPTSVLQIEVDETPSGVTPTIQIGQWSAGGDPEALLRAIDAYAHRLAQDAGVSASDIHKMSGDARSGYAISLTNEGKRAAQRRYAPVFQPVDERMMAVAATLFNRANDTALPEDGYHVVYAEIPLSPEEQQARREHVTELVGAGLMSRVRAYMALNPGVTEEQARRELEAIDAEQRPPEPEAPVVEPVAPPPGDTEEEDTNG